MDLFFLAAIVCLVVGLMVIIGAWAFDLFREADQEEVERRFTYQRAMREVIVEMTQTPVLIPDLEWTLHSLIYEYRNG